MALGESTSQPNQFKDLDSCKSYILQIEGMLDSVFSEPNKTNSTKDNSNKRKTINL